ncbi:MAG: MFS transporter [Bacteroidota bacterium]
MPDFSRLNPFSPFLRNRSVGAIGLIFLLHSLPLSTWILYIPLVKDKLQLTESEIGIGLFCFAMGALCVMPLSSIFIRKWGDGRVTFYSALVLYGAFILPLLAPTYVLLCMALFIAGFFGGLMDIAMNAVASLLESSSNQYIMSGCHGFFSLGAMLGAGLGGMLIHPQFPPALHMACLSILLVLGTFLLKPHFFSIKDEYVASEKPKFTILPLMGLAIICMIFMMSEGAIHDWSTIFMRDVKLASPQAMGLGFAAFSGSMALGRFYGDALQARLRPGQIIYFGSIGAILGLFIVLNGTFGFSILGFALVGLGLSGMIPTLFRAAANQPDVSAAQGIATLSGIGYVGFLLGPVVFGFIADWYSLPTTFASIMGLLLLALGLVPLFFKTSTRKQGA